MSKFTPLSRWPILFLMVIGIVIAVPVSADIVPISTPANGVGNQFNSSGTGYGTVNTLVDLQAKDNEVGSSTPNGTMTCNNGVCTKVGTGDSTQQAAVYTLDFIHNSILLGGDASTLAIIFNVSQTGASDLLSINYLHLYVFDSSFNKVATYTCAATCLLSYAPITGNGQGTSGYGFKLDGASAADLDKWFTSNPGYWLGGDASFGKVGAPSNDGSDNIYLTSIAGQTPEPSSLLMLGSGLLVAVGAFRRRYL